MQGLDESYWVPECVKGYLCRRGWRLALEDIEPHILEWDTWMRARGDFYDYRDTDGFGRVYEVHRRSIMPAMRVCREWGSLLLNENTLVTCERQQATDWLSRFLASCSFWDRAHETVSRAFGLETGAVALWLDTGYGRVRLRHYDARMVVPLSWDADAVTESAFVTRAFARGKALDQLQMHVVGPDGLYHIEVACFDMEGNEVEVPGVAPLTRTGSPYPTFGIIRPAVPNTRVDMSPYGQSVFTDAIDAIQSVDLAFDALINKVNAGKIRVFLSDVMFDREKDAKGQNVPIPFGKGDCTVFRKVMSTEDTISEFAPALRTDAQNKALKLSLQVLGDLRGLDINYFDFNSVGYAKTATEVSADNSALMRNIKKHGNALAGAVADVAHATMACARALGKEIPEEGEISVQLDDSIVQDTDAEKKQDMAEVAAGLMQRWEYRCKWYGEDERTARRRAGEFAAPAAANL